MNIPFAPYRWFFGFAVAAVLLVAGNTGRAAVTAYSNPAQWNADVGSGLAVEDFADSTLAPGLTISFGQNIPGGTISGGAYHDVAVSQFNDAKNPRLGFGCGTPVFGADWDLAPGGRGDGVVLVLTLANGTTATFALSHPAGGAFNGFVGFVSDVAITSVRLDSPGTGVEELAVDNIRFRGAVGGQINFDDAANGTMINARYSCVTFTNPLGGDIFARNGSRLAPTAPNVVSVFATGLPQFDARFGAVDGRFASPVGTVSIDVRPVAPLEFLTALTKRPFLQAFDSANALLGTVYYAGALPTTVAEVGPTETLTFTSTANDIAAVRFSTQNPNSAPAAPPTYGLFDNLRFASTYALGINTVGSGTVSTIPSQARYPAGTFVTLTPIPEEGWKFARWTGDANSSDDPLTLTLDGDRTVTAIFEREPAVQATFCADFDAGQSPGLTMFGGARVDGGYLKLISVPHDSFGIAYVDDFNSSQPVVGFRATFDAALFGSTCCVFGLAPADGFSFNLVPAATVLSSPGYAQPAEEGLDQGLSVNFDTWDNGGGEAPAIEVKWLGQIIASAPFQSSQSPAGVGNPAAASRPVVVNLDPDGTIDVSYGGVAVLADVPTPYRASVIGTPTWVFGARVGAADDNHWIDNLCITTYTGPQLCNDFNAGLPGGVKTFGDARVDGGILKLMSVPNSGGIAYIEDFSGGRLVQAFRATFRAALFGSTCCGNGQFPADGFSFNLVPAATARSAPAYGEPAEEGLDEGLAINFDTWDNGAGEGPAIEVKWLGRIIASAPFQASQSPSGVTTAAAAWRDVVIDLNGNGKLDVSYGGTTVLRGVQVPIAVLPAAVGVPVWVLGARAGGANDNHWIDDLCITMQPARARTIPTLFNTGVNAHGQPLAEDQVDPHYRVLINPIASGLPAFATTSAGGFPIPPWLPDNRSSAWISATTDTVTPGGPSAPYIYETAFDLTGFDSGPTSVFIFGRWSADNRGLGLALNGMNSPQSTPDFVTWSPIQLSGVGFQPGVNTLKFYVENDPDPSQPFPGPNPAGVRVELWGMANPDCSGQTPGPRLTVQRRGEEIQITWRGIGFLLESGPTVSGPWAGMTRGVVATGADFTATVPATRATLYFRLRQDCN